MSEGDGTKESVEIKQTSTDSDIEECYESESDADDEESGKEVEEKERRKFVKRHFEKAKSSLDSMAEDYKI